MSSFTSHQHNRVHTLTPGEIKSLTPQEQQVYQTLQKLFPDQPICQRQISATVRRNHMEYEFRSRGLETPTGIVVELIKDSATPEEIKMVESAYGPSGLTYIAVPKSTSNIEEMVTQKIKDLPGALKRASPEKKTLRVSITADEPETVSTAVVTSEPLEAFRPSRFSDPSEMWDQHEVRMARHFAQIERDLYRPFRGHQGHRGCSGMW